MKTRNGKIARLPNEIREQLNTRLANGEPGNRLVDWLNSNPVVTRIMAEHFDGRPINEGNVSEWRTGGFEEWLTLRSFLDENRILSENSGQIADTGISSERLHLVLLAHHAYLLQNLEIMPEAEFSKRLKAVTRLTASIMKMRHSEQNEIRLQLQRERLELLREIQSLKSPSTSKPAASSSNKAQSNSAETRSAAPPPASLSGPAIPSNPKSSLAESVSSLLSTPRPKNALKTPPLTGSIQPEFPDPGLHFPVSGFPSPVSKDRSDSVVLDLISPLRPSPWLAQLFPEGDSVNSATRARYARMSRSFRSIECASQPPSMTIAPAPPPRMHCAKAHNPKARSAHRMEAGASTPSLISEPKSPLLSPKNSPHETSFPQNRSD